MNNALEMLRREMLVGGLSGALPLTAVDSRVSQHMPEASDEDVQATTLKVIRSLVEEGLVALGDLSTDTGRLIAWNEPVEESMHKISASYVAAYDDEDAWIWSVWLELTEMGKLVALKFRESGR